MTKESTVSLSLSAAATAVLMTLSPGCSGIPDGTRFYTPRPDPGAVQQIAQLEAAGQHRLAHQIRTMIDTPQAVWVTGGSGPSLTKSSCRPDQWRKNDIRIACVSAIKQCDAYK